MVSQLETSDSDGVCRLSRVIQGMDHYRTLCLTHHFSPPPHSQRKWEKQLTPSGSANTMNTFFCTFLICCQAQDYAHACA